MLRSVDGLGLRQLRARPLRALLTGFGVVLGVGMVFGVLLLVGTIRHTFDDLIGSAWGKTDLIVSGTSNGLLPDSALARTRAVPGVRDAAAMVGGDLNRLRADGTAIKGAAGRVLVAGYDTRATMTPYDFRWVGGREPAGGPEVALEQNWARQRDLAVGDRIRLATPTGPVTLPIVGIFRFSSGLSFGGQGFGAMPIDAARRLFGIDRGYMQISVAVEDKRDVPAMEKRLGAVLGPGAQVKTPQAFGSEVKEQLNSLNVVLSFFSGVALFVGGFLILNAFNMTVLQRMREIGTLRTLGASRRLVTRTVLVEAATIGVVGSVLGLGLGVGLALGLIALMRGVGMPVGDVHVTAGPAIAAFILGMVVTLLGAAWPARRAGRISPIRAVLGSRGARTTPSRRRLAAGAVLFVPGLLFGGEFWGGNGSGSALSGLYGIGLTMTMFAGMAMLAPYVLIPVVRLLAWPLRVLFPAGGRLAADSLLSNPLRTAATAAALTIGLSVVVVNSTLSASFMGTVSDQLHQSFARDFTVQAAGHTLMDGGGPGVPKDLVGRIAAMPETRAVTPIRALWMDLPGIESGQKQGVAVAYDPAVYGLMDATRLEGASRADALAAVARGGAIIGPQYAQLAGLRVGDRIHLQGPRGTADVPVAGIIDSIAGGEFNEMQISLATMRRVYGVTADAQVAVRARSDAAAAALGRRVDALIAREYPGLEVASLADRKAEIDQQISATFNMFNSIVAIAVIVSLLGVVNTLAMSVIERTREIGVLRALGSTRWQVRRTMIDESLLITAAGALTGIAAGLAIGIAWLPGFAQSMPGLAFHFPTGITFSVAVAAVILGTLAAVLPARRAARLNVIEALAYE
ncbi:MAG TPA: FtsX-like permease family protein [Solirubrobacteraceae bacterium]|nr:FtsX-like permease family protein [Solirubrobacteraceae bacterium]